MTTNILQASLNAGEVSRYALARVDLAKLRLACELERNFVPSVLGPAQFRPGTAYTGVEIPGNEYSWLGEFYYSEKPDKKALLILTPAGLYFYVDGKLVARPNVSSNVLNGDFSGGLTNWTISDEAGATSTAITGGVQLLGTGTNYAFIDQLIVTGSAGVEHAIRVDVGYNDVLLMVGPVQGDGSYLTANLSTGVYSLAILPSGNFWIRIGANNEYASYVTSVQIETSGSPMSLPTPWSSREQFASLRYDQSGDILYFSGGVGVQQRRIERWTADSRSWGIAKYRSDDGPFRLSNISSTTIQPGSTTGNVSLTASRPIFHSGHFGALFRLTHTTQSRSAVLAAVNNTTDGVRVTGLTAHPSNSTSPGNASTRGFTISISGTFNATIQLQRSLGVTGNWADVSGKSWTAPTDENYDDGLDNQIIFYRLKCTAYTSGSASVRLSYVGSAQNGIVRLTQISTTTSAYGDVLSEFGDTAAVSDWAEGEWSEFRGWPAATVLDGGRLGWFQNIKAQLSVSDSYGSFDSEVIGDSGPIDRIVTTGGYDGIRWALSLQRLVLGTLTQVISIRSSAFDEPLTPTAFTAKVCSDDGVAADVRPLRLQTQGIYAGASSRLFKLQFDVAGLDYESVPLDRLNPEMFAAGIADMAVQRKPDNAHVWIVRKDGTAALLVYSRKEELEALVSIDTDGLFERVAVLPGSPEDEIYFIVNRFAGGQWTRLLEKLSLRTDSQGGLLSKTLDSHVVYSGAAATVIGGMAHLEGSQVAVWVDGQPSSEMPIVTGGTVTLSFPATNAVIGLPYYGRIKTAKLAYAAEHGTALGEKKRVSRVGLNMSDVSWKGVRIGRDFDHMTGLPTTYKGKPLTVGQVLPEYDVVPSAFNGGWDEDSRVCIEVKSPHACTLRALVFHIETNDAVDPPPAPRRSEGQAQ